MPPFDSEMVAHVPGYLRKAGVDVYLGAKVESIGSRPLADGGRLARTLVLTGGTVLDIDMAIVAAGVKPLVGLAAEAGLQLGATGGVLVDDHMRTSDESIFAAGDIVESVDLVTGLQTRLPLAGPANKQARVAGSNAAGGSLTFKGVVGSSIVKLLGLTLAKTGLSERDAKAKGIAHFVSYTHNGHSQGTTRVRSSSPSSLSWKRAPVAFWGPR